MSEYAIRRAHVADANQLADLAAQGIPGYPFTEVYQADAVEEGIAAGELRVLAESPEMRIIGTAVLGISGVMAEIKRVVVAPQMRQNGVAKALTLALKAEANLLGINPWADVRADQIGMQRSATAAGLIPYSLEPGKHVVYEHQNSCGQTLGPARETMVHMSSLQLPWADLAQALSHWPQEIQMWLWQNLANGLNPQTKNRIIVNEQLPNPQIVKQRVGEKLTELGSEVQIDRLDQNLCIVNYKGASMVVVQPDSSAFILSDPNQHLFDLVDIVRYLGLQVATIYVNPSKTNTLVALTANQFSPTLIRPWQEKEESEWQIGWQLRLNGFANSLHSINLDRVVQEQLEANYIHLKQTVDDHRLASTRPQQLLRLANRENILSSDNQGFHSVIYYEVNRAKLTNETCSYCDQPPAVIRLEIDHRGEQFASAYCQQHYSSLNH